jgi:hypothetical protein
MTTYRRPDGSVAQEYQARRAGDRILCGRPTPIGPCIGEIGSVAPSGWFTETPRGMVEDPPGSGYWRWTRRAQLERVNGQIVRGNARRRGVSLMAARTTFARARREAPMVAPPELPWRRTCDVCRTVALVTRDLLTS